MRDFSVYNIAKQTSHYEQELLLKLAAAQGDGKVFNIIKDTSEYEAAKALEQLGILENRDGDYSITRDGDEFVMFLGHQEAYH